MTETLKTIIIEDEQPAIDLLTFYLKDFKQIQIIDICKDGFEGLKNINSQKPDLVFLDIQMPKLNGFEMLELLEHKPMIIFTTAFDEFAIKAFELSALDYLLKPFSLDRLQQAIEKIKANNNKEEKSKYNNLIEYGVNNESQTLLRIVVKKANQVNFLQIDDIFYLEAQDDYVMIYTKDNHYLKQSTMKYFESGLDANKFMRVHRSFIVNIDKIRQIEAYEKDSHIAILTNKAHVKISKTGLKKLKDKFNF